MNNTIDFNTAKTIGTMSKKIDHIDDTVSSFFSFMHMVMLIVQDQVWGRVTANRSSGKSTRYYMDEMHLLLKEEQTAAYSVEIWKRFRKWGGVPTGLTQNVKDLLSSREVENIFENSDMIIMLNQAAGDRQILAKQLNISPHQLSYVTHKKQAEKEAIDPDVDYTEDTGDFEIPPEDDSEDEDTSEEQDVTPI